MSDSPERVKLSKEEKDRRFQAELMPVLDPLYNFAYRLTLDEDDANDLVQTRLLTIFGRKANSRLRLTTAKLKDIITPMK
jgi:DNA-directed RNA polymerase specialized sigma24 family protein